MNKTKHPNPIFIGGCGSSGSTLLRRMLNSHPNISCGKEMSVFDRPAMWKVELSWLKKMYNTQEFNPMEWKQPFLIIAGNKKIKQWSYFGLCKKNGVEENYHSEEEINKLFEMSSDVKEFCDLFFSNYADKQGKTRWAEKTPNNIFNAVKLLEVWKDAKFIHCIRDGRDVITSLHKRRGEIPHHSCIRWLMATKAGLNLRGNPRVYEVFYEDLVSDPEYELTRLCNFLGEDYNRSMLEFYKSGEESYKGYGDKPVNNKSVGQWKDYITDAGVLEVMDLLIGDRLRELHYEVD